MNEQRRADASPDDQRAVDLGDGAADRLRMLLLEAPRVSRLSVSFFDDLFIASSILGLEARFSS